MRTKAPGPEGHSEQTSPVDALRAMMRLSEVLAGNASLADVFDVSMETLTRLVGADRTAVLLLDQDNVMRFEADRGLSPSYRAAAEGHSPWDPDDRDPGVVLIRDALADASLAALHAAFEEERIRTIAFIPLVASGRLIGKFMAYHEHADAFSAESLDIAQTIGRHVAVAVERIRQQRALATQFAVTRTLAERSDAEAIPTVLKSLVELLGWAFGAVWWVNPDESLRCVATWSNAPGLEPFESVTRRITLSRGIGLPGRVLASGHATWLSDVTSDDNFPRLPVARDVGILTGIGFPVVIEGRVAGVIEFFATEIRSVDRELMALMENAGQQIGERLQRRETERKLTAGDALRSALFDAALDAVLTMDDEGRLMDLNGNAETMFGISHDAIGQRVADLVIPPEFRAAHEEGLRRYLATGETHVLGRRIELTGMRADGDRFPIELTVTRVAAPGSRAFTAFVRDISDARRREDSLAFLARIGPELNRSLDPERTLETVARLAVPQLADWSAAYLAEPDGSIRRLSLRYADPSGEAIASEIEASAAMDPDASAGVPWVIRTGGREFHPSASPRIVAADAGNSERQAELLASIDLRSWICVPVRARGEVVGAASFLATRHRTFGPDDLAIFSQLAERAGLALENALLYRDRDTTARVLQERLLPPALPEIAGLEVAATYLPAGEAEQVGGDFYDVFESGPNTWSLLVGDVCGKGITAAAVTSVARNAIRAAAVHDPAPSDSLVTANEILLSDPIAFVTACLVRLRRVRDGFRADASSAGHPLPLVRRRDGRVEELGTHGTVLGAVEDVQLHDRRTMLRPGDLLLLYTDGVSEHRMPSGELFGDERIVETLSRVTDPSVEGVLEALTHAIQTFHASPPRDDIALLALRVVPEADPSSQP